MNAVISHIPARSNEGVFSLSAACSSSAIESPRLRRFLATLLIAPAFVCAQSTVAPRAPDQPLETVIEFSCAGSAGIAEGTRALGRISGSEARVAAVRTHTLDTQSAWLLGASWQRLDFCPPAGAPIPSELTVLALKLGYSRQLDPAWALRLDIDPGLYSDLHDLGGGDFNAPFGLRLVRTVNRELQWLIALDVDLRSGTPVLGGAGARWQVTPDCTLLLMVPSPRVEWTVSPLLTLFVGADLRSGAFRVADDFGRLHARPLLDGQIVDYREISASAGLRWQLTPAVAVHAAAGWMFDRRFNYAERNLLLNGAGAATAQLTVTGTF
jgi:hypothetical protein